MRCGLLFPMSRLVMQKGLLVCTDHCHDDLTVERMPLVIMSILGNEPQIEGEDRRWVDRAFYDPYEEQI